MRPLRPIVCGLAVGLFVLLGACTGASGPSNLVGAWLINIPGAPFPNHLFAFHADGTVVQSNPDAGDGRTSDSALMGAWRPSADGYQGTLVEVTADRDSHAFAGRTVITLNLRVRGDRLTGDGVASFYRPDGGVAREPVRFTLSGERIRVTAAAGR